VLAFWNAPVSVGSQHAFLAVEAALKQQERLAELRCDWEKRGLPLIKTRIGINTGMCLAGNVGSKNRLKFTLVGDMVNLASRLEALCKQYGVYLLITGQVYEAPGVKERFCVQFIELVSVVGRSEPTFVLTVLCRREAASSTQLQLESLSEKMIQCLVIGELKATIQLLNRMLELQPENAPARLILNQCMRLSSDMLLQKQWTGVRKLSEK
jgi:adenylate cyclase